jgi:hypothetical protein
VLNEILAERVVSSRGRRNPRKVKHVRGKYPLRPAFEPLPKRVHDYANHILLN